jgi:hypothetical protein
VPDEPTPGEVYRRLQDHEQRTAMEHRALDERITAVAQQSVPMVAYQADQRARDAETVRLDREHAADVARLDREREQSDRQANDRLAKIEDRPAMTMARWIGVAMAVCAALALVVQAYGTLRGAK